MIGNYSKEIIEHFPQKRSVTSIRDNGPILKKTNIKTITISTNSSLLFLKKRLSYSFHHLIFLLFYGIQ